ncbi:MAG: bifunctional ADP-heptose synthase [Chloroflexi bacterium]|nr:bifunctional ADP-heptose synthase [Chloroflexota bacterium]
MPTGLVECIPQLAEKKVLVIGDVMLDEYITGTATRMSREAPVPVLELESRRHIAGGAANPAATIVALGSQAIQVGVVGADEAGQRLRGILRARDIDSGVITCAGRPTTVKTRILAQMGLRFPQQITRIDTLTRAPIDAETEAEISAFVNGQISSVDAALLSHYHGGLLTPSLVVRLRTLCAANDVLLTADVQGDFETFAGLDVIKCNADDARRALNREMTSDAEFRQGALDLHERLGIQRVTIITRGGQGATWAAGGRACHCPAPRVSDVYDTVGAGDTAIATITLGLAGGLSAQDAVRLANIASGIVVRHLGNYAPTPEQMRQGIMAAL